MGEISIVAVSLGQKIAITDDGEQIELTDFYDEDGDEIDDPTEAVVVVGKVPSGGWCTIDMREFVDARLQ